MYAKSCSAAAGDSSYSPWMIFKPISLFFPPKGREGPIAAAAPQQLAFILLQGKECRDALQGSRGWYSKDSKKTLEPEISWTRLIEKSFFSFVYLSLGSIFAYNHCLQVSSSNLASPTRPIPWRSYSQPLQTLPASLLLVIHNEASNLFKPPNLSNFIVSLRLRHLHVLKSQTQPGPAALVTLGCRHWHHLFCQREDEESCPPVASLT